MRSGKTDENILSSENIISLQINIILNSKIGSNYIDTNSTTVNQEVPPTK